MDRDSEMLEFEVTRCYLCGEAFSDEDAKAEIARNDIPEPSKHYLVHAECYLAQQEEYELA